jgi:hypothetical protein
MNDSLLETVDLRQEQAAAVDNREKPRGQMRLPNDPKANAGGTGRFEILQEDSFFIQYSVDAVKFPFKSCPLASHLFLVHATGATLWRGEDTLAPRARRP